MVERAVGAQLAHINAVIGVSSRAPPFMTSWKRLCCSICSMVCRSLSCSLFHAALLFICVCWFRITEQSLHPLRDRPIARLSASLQFAMCLCCFFRYLRALCLCCFLLESARFLSMLSGRLRKWYVEKM